MIIPLKELEGFTYTEHINLKNGLNIIRNFDKIISALPKSRQLKIQEKRKEFDFVLTLKKLCKNNSPMFIQLINFLNHLAVMVDYLPHLDHSKIYPMNSVMLLELIIMI